MPYICTKTGEMHVDGLPDADVSVETSPRTLISRVVVEATSDETHDKQRWAWKEVEELDKDQLAKYHQLKAEADAKKAAEAAAHK